MLDKLLKAIGREALKERRLVCRSLSRLLQGVLLLSKQQESQPTTAEVGIVGRFKDESRDESGMPLQH